MYIPCLTLVLPVPSIWNPSISVYPPSTLHIVIAFLIGTIFARHFVLETKRILADTLPLIVEVMDSA